VAWSDLTKGDFADDYWRKLWSWYRDGGYGHVAAFLSTLDISDLDPKAPPPKSEAFWAIVDANPHQRNPNLLTHSTSLGILML
jgi:hypothetical protein